MIQHGWLRCILVVLALGTLGCESGGELLLASTTSTEDSGLFDALIPAFRDAYPGYDVHVTAVGTGQALVLGRRDDADVLLVHAPAAESAFVANGYGTARCEVMYNDFVLVGPPADPAALRGLDSVTAGLARLEEAATSEAGGSVTFISRGDDSGTHRKEQALWRAADVEPAGRWYMEVGQGMAETLRMAGEQRAYTLSDRATFLAQRDDLGLEVVLEGDPRLFNQYGVIPVAGAANPAGAAAFARWVTGEAAQRIIGGFGEERFGRPLFIPNAGECEIP